MCKKSHRPNDVAYKLKQNKIIITCIFNAVTNAPETKAEEPGVNIIIGQPVICGEGDNKKDHGHKIDTKYRQHLLRAPVHTDILHSFCLQINMF